MVTKGRKKKLPPALRCGHTGTRRRICLTEVSGMNHKLRWLLVILLLLLLIGAVLLGCFRQKDEALPTGSWGLSFPTEGQASVGNTSNDRLLEYNAAYLGDTSKKVIYLTFDAGYENGCTEKILDTLKAHNAPAAFFLVGNYIEKNPELVKRMIEDGHIVGNHTYHHWDMSKISDEATFRSELESLEDLYTQVTGKTMEKYYRPPQGIYSEENLKMAQDMGYHTVFWSLAYVDWLNDDQPTKEQAFAKLLPRIHDGAVVLLHSTSQTNAEILDELLTKWEAMGYTFGTIDELFAQQEKTS